MSKQVATIIGAGIQGCVAALQLEKLGFRVQLVEKCHDIFTRASLNQEGKIHLGMVYALDESMATGHKIIEDALFFAPLFEELIDAPVRWDAMASTPFHYLVERNSLLDADSLAERYALLENIYAEKIRDKDLHYLGERPVQYYSRVQLPKSINPAIFSGAFLTPEKAVDPKSVKELIWNRLRSRNNITIYLRHDVCGIDTDDAGFVVTCRFNDDKDVLLKSDIVVNATWEAKRKVDAMVGIEEERPWTVRMKMGFFLPPAVEKVLPTFVIVHGPYGDHVNFPRQNYRYLSWYPVCRIGITESLIIPDTWESILSGNLKGIDVSQIGEAALRALDNISMDSANRITDFRVGSIVAYGTRDINVLESGLHHRSETAVEEHNGYFTINTSKFTSAPNNARKLRRMLCG